MRGRFDPGHIHLAELGDVDEHVFELRGKLIFLGIRQLQPRQVRHMVDINLIGIFRHDEAIYRWSWRGSRKNKSYCITGLEPMNSSRNGVWPGSRMEAAAKS